MNIGEDRILDFLDGRLTTPDEESLLHTLAVSPERRQVLREHMKVRQLTSDLAQQEQFNVPERLTNQLFAQLEDMGYSAPLGTEAILTRAPEFVSMRAAMPVAGEAATAGAAAGAAAGSAAEWGSGFRFGAISLVTVALLSFFLGAGAYYVFGSALGLRTLPEELAARHPAVLRLARHSAPAMQYDLAEALPVGKNISTTLGGHITTATVASVGRIGSMGPMGRVSDIPSTSQQSVSQNKAQPDIAAITYTAPRQPVYAMATVHPRYLSNLSAIWPDAISSSLSDHRGTISVRYGIGAAPDATSSRMSTLNEFRIGWKMGYFMGAASMGQLTSIERTAQSAALDPLHDSKGFTITTPEAAYPVSTTLIGLEGGLTLDPLGVPINAMVGFMFSGAGSSEYSTFYKRASLMIHFEPWRLLTISGGIEGLWYTHYLNNAITDQRKLNSHYTSTLSPDAITQEAGGLVGPTLEVGWHF